MESKPLCQLTVSIDIHSASDEISFEDAVQASLDALKLFAPGKQSSDVQASIDEDSMRLDIIPPRYPASGPQKWSVKGTVNVAPIAE